MNGRCGMIAKIKIYRGDAVVARGTVDAFPRIAAAGLGVKVRDAIEAAMPDGPDPAVGINAGTVTVGEETYRWETEPK